MGLGSEGKVVRTVIAREIDVPVGAKRQPAWSAGKECLIDFDAGVINAVGKNQLCHFDFVVRQPAPAFCSYLVLVTFMTTGVI